MQAAWAHFHSESTWEGRETHEGWFPFLMEHGMSLHYAARVVVDVPLPKVPLCVAWLGGPHVAVGMRDGSVYIVRLGSSSNHQVVMACSVFSEGHGKLSQMAMVTEGYRLPLTRWPPTNNNGRNHTGAREHAQWLRDAVAELLVVGQRGLTGFSAAVLGSVATHVVHHAAMPVAVIPDPD